MVTSSISSMGMKQIFSSEKRRFVRENFSKFFKKLQNIIDPSNSVISWKFETL